MSYHLPIGERHQRQKHAAVLTKRIDNSAFLLLTKRLPIHLPNSIRIRRLFVSDFYHFRSGAV